MVARRPAHRLFVGPQRHLRRLGADAGNRRHQSGDRRSVQRVPPVVARRQRDRVRVGSPRHARRVHRQRERFRLECRGTIGRCLRRCCRGSGVRSRRFIDRVHRARRRTDPADDRGPFGRRRVVWHNVEGSSQYSRHRRGCLPVPPAMGVANRGALHGRRQDQTAAGGRRRRARDRAYRGRVVHPSGVHTETAGVRSLGAAAGARDHASRDFAGWEAGGVRGGRRSVGDAGGRRAAAADA